ncbi:polysaccharide deacetylase family protein [Bacteroides congonensis]|uniref:polysaccharide deacetylase family protein n=1 Tax=Bacteroides congonensis TaxID=1871006 RepID=UPI00189C9357|nr:polysaccharide deacetylase family protein [Bacteroides congonensis]
MGVVLMYHDVFSHSKKESGFQTVGAIPYKISVEDFEKQLIAIRDYCEKNGLSNETVRLTFDDGGVSFYTVILDILEKYGFRGIFFISTAFVGTDGFLNEEQIRMISDRGHEIGAHSHTHPSLNEASNMSEQELIDEWTISIKYLNVVLGYSTTSVSLPNGFCSKIALKSILDCGIKQIYTSTATTKRKYWNGSEMIGRYAVQDGMLPEHVLSIVKSPIIRMKLKIISNILLIAKFILGSYYSKFKKKLLSKS